MTSPTPECQRVAIAMPIMKPDGIDLKGKSVPTHVRMSSFHQEWAARNHGQTLERLAERGGLDVTEAAAIYQRRRWRPMLIEDALAAIEPYAFSPTTSGREGERG